MALCKYLQVILIFAPKVQICQLCTWERIVPWTRNSYMMTATAEINIVLSLFLYMRRSSVCCHYLYPGVVPKWANHRVIGVFRWDARSHFLTPSWLSRKGHNPCRKFPTMSVADIALRGSVSARRKLDLDQIIIWYLAHRRRKKLW